ncbi:carboxymuconolactone decarboxylase family protein [Taibaiella chishuiensis]|uniref:AhpD family alkylhydroperoxidase n=1 Tax=Taibaiella chishuiensis TaxID=1434707 RepID=A0A2P8D7T8_9BACT|nr:carboxymuconolactone decarboxylase family protein [Taibaiella chishuiensis]PSK93267.1 AhpD family alkylhydroperoxidase [Taibaiella chishuiensis]
MDVRINLQENGKQAFAALFGMNKYLSKCGIEDMLLELIYFRVSQINGCAYCLDMHAKDLRAKGETEQRLYLLSSWHEAPLYTGRERAALTWAEALTKLGGGTVPDRIYNAVREEFSEQEVIDLTVAVITINSYNRINIAFGAPVGTYEVGQFNS